METLGDRIKELRKRYHYTQSDMAIQLDMGRANYSHIENDRVTPSTATLQQIADILHTSTDYLLGRENDDSNERTPNTFLWFQTISEQEYVEHFKQRLPQKTYEAIKDINSIKELYEIFKDRAYLYSIEGQKTIIESIDDMKLYLELLWMSRFNDKVDEENNAPDSNKPAGTFFIKTDLPEPTIIPVVGTICAGLGMFAEENIEDYVYYPYEHISQPDFALKVQGDSMNGAGIEDGDIVFMKKRSWADFNGQIVAVITDNDTGSLRRMKWSEGSPIIELLPENPQYEVKKVMPNEIRICGVYMGFFRPNINNGE